jgi:MFS family permease
MLPKLFSERIPDVVGGSALGAGGLVTIVYLFAALAQYIGGKLSDRFPMKYVYIASYVIQTPLVLLAASLTGMPLLFFAVAMVFANTGSLPAENGLLAHFTPGRWRATAYGAKFVLSLGVSASAIPLVAFMHDYTGGFTALFVIFAALTAVVMVAGLFLPNDHDSAPARAPAAAPAE